MLKPQNFFLKKFFLSIIALVILAGCGRSVLFVFDRFNNEPPAIVQAASYSSGPPPTGDNVSGWAWSSNAGWLSFNSTGCDSNCPVGGPCVSDGVLSGCPAAGTQYPDYGVKIDGTTGNFSGYAWSANVGWISFDRSDAGNPPSNDPGSGVGPIAVVDLNPTNSTYGKISGWAKILSLGNDGWIRFSYANGSPQPFPIPFPFSEIGVGGLSYDAGIDTSNGEFFGWGWNGNDDGIGIGWISFNCINESICPTSLYKVIADINHSPTITSTNAPLVDYCSLPITAASLGWSFDDPDGDTQSAYQIIFNNINNINSPLLDTGKCTSQTGNCLVIASASTFPVSNIVNLSTGTTYYWWVRVWDSKGAPSIPYQGTTFTTPTHKYPAPYFNWLPASPSANEEVYFHAGDLSQYFDNANNGYVCSDASCSYQWKFTYKVGGNTPISIPGASDTSSSTIIAFPDKATVHAALTVTDSSGYFCSTSTSPNDIGLKSKLPKWIETK